MALKFLVIPVTHYQQNTSLIWCSETGKGAVVDPGGEVSRILAQIDKNSVQVEQILLTHGHLDHVGGAKTLAAQLNVPIVGPHPDDAFWLDKLEDQAARMGFDPAEPLTPSRWLHHGDQIKVGELVLDVYHCPGHTPGHLVFVNKAHDMAWVGDVLFAGSIGRTDFPRGDYDTLVRSIRTRLWPLGDQIQFLPGHGPMSTFGEERASNPFVADKRFG